MSLKECLSLGSGHFHFCFLCVENCWFCGKFSGWEIHIWVWSLLVTAVAAADFGWLVGHV